MLIIAGAAIWRGANAESMILLGIALSFFFQAVLSLLQYVASNEALQQIVFWTMGSMQRASWTANAVIAVVLALAIPFCVVNSWRLTALRLGDDRAAALGLHDALRRWVPGNLTRDDRWWDRELLDEPDQRTGWSAQHLLLHTEADGTATWSLSTLRRALRTAPDGLPTVSTDTIRRTLRASGSSYQRTRTWCPTGTAVRRRKAGPAMVADPDAESKKS